MPHGAEKLCLAVLLLASAVPECLAATQPVNWSGAFSPCNNHSEFLKHDFMNLGVHISSSNRTLAREFQKAMDFWANILDMTWHNDNSATCAVQLVDGTPEILADATVARSQFTGWANFQGWIAFDPRAPLTRTEMYVTAVHEIGHMLGLQHNPNANSIMYYIDLEGTEVLDANDLAALAEHHKLRLDSRQAPIVVNRPHTELLKILAR